MLAYPTQYVFCHCLASDQHRSIDVVNLQLFHVLEGTVRVFTGRGSYHFGTERIIDVPQAGCTRGALCDLSKHTSASWDGVGWVIVNVAPSTQNALARAAPVTAIKKSCAPSAGRA